MLTTLLLLGADLAAIALLTFGLYLRRHHRRDLVPAFIGVNIGVFAVAAVLGSTEVSLGLGLGLFGVLSIIRLRSSELSQHEVAYYFAALALGLISGLTTTAPFVQLALLGLILAALAVADHPAIAHRSRHQLVVLDEAIADEARLRERLASELGGEVLAVTVLQLDLVNDSTRVDVRYRVGGRRAAPTTAGAERVIAAPAAERGDAAEGMRPTGAHGLVAAGTALTRRG